MSANIVTLAIPAKTEYLILARLALAGIAREVSMSESVLADLKLAVTEACGNAIRHAYGDGHGVVRVRFLVEREHIEIEVRDEGTAGGRASKPEPLEGGALLESGMGLAIISAVVDELDIEGPADAPGTIVRMRKALALQSS